MAESKPFDELWGTSRNRKARPGFEPLANWLSATPAAELARRQQAAEAAFRSLGITFSVYGDEEAAERIIPFDIIPRIFSAAEWEKLSAGLEQRVRAINAFIDDVYGARRIIADGVIPADIVLGNPQYCIPVAGARAPHGVYAHICGIDLVRTGPDDFLRAGGQCPHALGRLLHDREPRRDAAALPGAVRHLPGAAGRFLSRAAARHALFGGARAAPGSRAACCSPPATTTAPFTSTASSPTIWASSWSRARDLEVDDDIVWMKTIDGRVRVDVIYRRIDDAFLDPLVFRPDSMLGVPGLMAAYLAGNVTLVNAPGTGIADDKAIYSYMPEIVRYYTGEEPRLPNVETWRCRDPQALRYTLDNLDKLVVKLVDGSGGYGMLVGPAASKAEIAAFRDALKAEPERYIAQPTLALSTVPIHTDAGMAPRHVDFRPFVLTGANGVTIVPGGLTRVALREGSLVVNSSQGGGTKDSFVLAPEQGAGA